MSNNIQPRNPTPLEFCGHYSYAISALLYIIDAIVGTNIYNGGINILYLIASVFFLLASLFLIIDVHRLQTMFNSIESKMTQTKSAEIELTELTTNL